MPELTAAKYAKARGIKKMSLITEFTGLSAGTLNQMYKNPKKRKLFNFLIDSAIYFSETEKNNDYENQR